MGEQGQVRTGAGIKSQILRKVAEDVVREDFQDHEIDEHRERVARADRLAQVVEHPFFGEVEAILIQDVLGIAYASDDNLLIRASSARGSLRSIDRIWRAIKEGEHSATYLAELDQSAKKEKEDESGRRQERDRSTRPSRG